MHRAMHVRLAFRFRRLRFGCSSMAESSHQAFWYVIFSTWEWHAAGQLGQAAGTACVFFS